MSDESVIEAIKRRIAITDLARCRNNGHVRCPHLDCDGHAKQKERCNVRRESFRCFYCGRGGNVFDWYMAEHGCDFKEALHALAAEAGITLRPNKERTELLHKVVLAANRYLMSHPEIRAHLEFDRGIDRATLFRYQIGYVDADGDVLRASGVPARQLLQLGLLYPPFKEGEKYASAMANRFIFPVRDTHGRLVQLKGRVDPRADVSAKVKKDKKSLPLVSKSEFAPTDWGSHSIADYLYLEETLREAQQSFGYVVLCEGEPDTLTWRSLGFPAVGLPGNQGILKHTHKFKQFDTVYDARDNDAATEKFLSLDHFELQTALPTTAIKRVKIPYLAGDGVKVDGNDLKARYGWERDRYQQLLDDAIPAFQTLVAELASSYAEEEAFMKLRRLYQIAPAALKPDMLLTLVTVTGVPAELMAFSLDPRSRAHAS